MSLTGFIGLVEAAAPYSYLTMLLIAIAEVTIFLGFIPNLRNTIITSGFIAHQGGFDLTLLFIVIFAGTIIGNFISYLLGKRYGKSLLSKYGKYLKVEEKHIRLINDYMENHFGKTLFIGRFNSITRTFTPFLAGSSKIKITRFTFHVLLNAIAWTIILLGIGFGIGIGYANLGIYALVASIVVLLLITSYFARFAKVRGYV